MADDDNPTPDDDKGGTDKTFTQSDVDRIVTERLARERKNYSDYDDLKAKADKYDELEAENKSEVDKLRDQLDAEKNKAGKASRELERLDVALSKAPDGMPISKVRKLAKRLDGESREDLEADADDLFAEFQPAGDDDQGDEGKPSDDRPKPRLNDDTPSDDTSKSPEELADAVMKRQRGY